MIGDQIKKFRAASGLSQKSLADALYVSQQAVGKWERGDSTPNPDTVVRIAQIFGITTDELLGQVEKGTAGGSRIPVLGEIPAGIPIEAVEEILDWEEIPPEWSTGGRQYFGLKVKGDSMWPRYMDGDTVILQKEKACDSGDDCAVLVNGDAATLKQVYMHDDGCMEIRPLNPSYPPRTFSPSEIQSLPVVIAGVVWSCAEK